MSARSDLPRRHRAVLGAAGAVLTAALVVLALAYGNGAFDGGYRLTAVFPTSSQGIFTDGGTDVKLRGVNVGTVDGIELLPDGEAEITLRIDDGVAVPASASATIEPLSVFGPKFVLLDPGDLEVTGPWLGDGDRIAETSVASELTDLVDASTELFGVIDPRELLAVTRAVADAFGGLGGDIGAVIDATGDLARVGRDHAAQLGGFLGDLARITGTVADHADDVVSIASDLEEVLGVVDDGAADLDDLLAVTTDISTTFSDLLRGHEADFTTFVTTIADLVHGIHERSGDVPDILDLVGTFFGRLSDVIRFEGPAGTGTQLAGLRGFVALDLCLLFDLCPGGGS